MKWNTSAECRIEFNAEGVSASRAGLLGREARNQLEIPFEGPGPIGCRQRPRTERGARRRRAVWWFHRMRQAVNRAMDWTPAPAARPLQTHLALESK